jgi:hypothetical protein
MPTPHPINIQIIQRPDHTLTHITIDQRLPPDHKPVALLAHADDDPTDIWQISLHQRFTHPAVKMGDAEEQELKDACTHYWLTEHQP